MQTDAHVLHMSMRVIVCLSVCFVYIHVVRFLVRLVLLSEFLRRRRSGHIWREKMLRHSQSVSNVLGRGELQESKKRIRISNPDGIAQAAGSSLLKFAKYSRHKFTSYQTYKEKRKIQKCRTRSSSALSPSSPTSRSSFFKSYVDSDKGDGNPTALGSPENTLSLASRSKSSESLSNRRALYESDEDLLGLPTGAVSEDGLSDEPSFGNVQPVGPARLHRKHAYRKPLQSAKVSQSVPLLTIELSEGVANNIDDEVFNNDDTSSDESDVSQQEQAPLPGELQSSPTSDSGVCG